MAIYAVFTVGFLTRSIYDFTVTVDGSNLAIWLGLALPLFWDCLPIFLTCLLHLREVRNDRREAVFLAG
jgi:hypothetical protein